MKTLNSMGLKIEGNTIFVLDQQALPQKEIWLKCTSPDDMVHFIKTLKIRGAPLIGVGAAMVLAQFVENGASLNELTQAAKKLKAARPTAVNLMAAVDRIFLEESGENLQHHIVSRAEQFFEEDVALCKSIGVNGAAIIKDGDNILTHCNSGGLATAGIGTALGVIRHAFEAKKKIHVYVDETRPLLQGARLTTWEFGRLGIPYTLICDNMAASLMKSGKIQKVIVGADRIASNGDFANKIGTYGLAVLAFYHKIPFYVAAPSTTIDWNCLSGSEIPIEERHASEVYGSLTLDCPVYNPAFDVTPHHLVTGYILDSGLKTSILRVTSESQLSV